MILKNLHLNVPLLKEMEYGKMFSNLQLQIKEKCQKKGVLDVYFDGEKHVTLTQGITAESIGQKSSLVIYYENGKTFFDKKDTFQNVKNRLEGVIK